MELRRRQRAKTGPTSWRLLAGLAVLVLSGAPVPAAGQTTPACQTLPRGVIEVELPPGQDQVEEVVSMTWDYDFWNEALEELPDDCATNSRLEAWLDRYDPTGQSQEAQERAARAIVTYMDTWTINLETDGVGQFEVTIELAESDIEFLQKADEEPHALSARDRNRLFLASLPVVQFDEANPDVVEYPNWIHQRTFSGPWHSLDMRSTWSRAVFREGIFFPARRLELRITIRRVTSPCFMVATVGDITYDGHVAVLGNPTGVSDSTLDMLFGVDEEERVQAPIRLQEFEDVLNSDAGLEALERMPEENIEGLQAYYRQLAAHAEQVDPVREVREMRTLTLEDVNLKAAPPSTSLAGMAGHFVLSAQLGAPGKGGWGGVGFHLESVGVKGPGLGLASTNVERCPGAAGGFLFLKPCDGEWASESWWEELDQIDCVRGGIIGAKVCDEEVNPLDVGASFRAARSVEQCLP